MSNPAAARARAYDIVLNGVELGGGSIRINRPEVQYRVFEALGIGRAEADERFGFLIEALQHGAPPHGGIALGIDRIAALLAGRESIRDVIAFPKTASGADPLTGAPAPLEPSAAEGARDPGRVRPGPRLQARLPDRFRGCRADGSTVAADGRARLLTSEEARACTPVAQCLSQHNR